MIAVRCILIAFWILIQYAAGFANALSNANFESWSGDRPSNWDLSGTSYIAHEGAIRHGGNASAEITVPTSSSTVELSQDVPVQSGRVYTFKAFVYDQAENGKIGLLINWRNEAGHVSTVSSGKSATGGGWQEIGLYDREVPEGATLARVRIRVYKEDEGGGVLYVDDAVFSGDGSLPVTVTTFQAELMTHWVELSWSTDQEKDVDSFSLTKSMADAADFVEIARIQPMYRQGGVYYYRDFNIDERIECVYQLEERLSDGSQICYGPVRVQMRRDDAESRNELSGVYPNPFNPAVQIRYYINNPKEHEAELMVFDVHGRMIRRWPVGGQAAGMYSQLWNGCDALGQSVASGLYFVVLRSGGICGSVQKMVKVH